MLQSMGSPRVGQDLVTDQQQQLRGGTFIQYIDDLLICSPPQLQAIQHTIQVLSFLAEWSYKVSKSRAQLV